MFIEVIGDEYGNTETRLININHIKQVAPYSDDKIKLDFIDNNEYVVISSTLKDFKTKIKKHLII